MMKLFCLTITLLLTLAASAYAASDSHGQPSDHAPAATAQDADHPVEAADGHSEEHGGGGGSSLLSPDFGTAFWTVALFVLLLIVLGKFVWPPIVQGLQQREQHIHNEIVEARQANEQASKLLAEYEQKLTDAQVEARRVFDQTRTEADQLRQKLVNETSEEITRMKQRAQQEISSARQQAVQDLYAQAAELATAVAGKILQRQINDSDAQRLVDESLKAMDQQKVG